MSSLPSRPAADLPDLAGGDARALPGGHRLDAYQLQGAVTTTDTSVTYLATDLNLGVSVLLVEYFPAALAWRDASGLVVPAETRYASAYQRGLMAFVDEARALARCDHPSLDRVLRLWQGGGTAYRVVPQHLQGKSLFEVRREMAGPPDEAALQLLMDGLLGALDAFHRAGHVHGSVHPGNILLLDDDRPLLLAPDWAGRKLTAEFAGTPAVADHQPGFAPWEQSAAPLKPLPGAWVDLYALSEVVRFCISGELPPPASRRRLGASGEPSAELVRRLFGDALNWRYGTRLLSTLDAATSGRPLERPASVGQFREWLANGPPYPDRTEPADTADGVDADMDTDLDAGRETLDDRAGPHGIDAREGGVPPQALARADTPSAPVAPTPSAGPQADPLANAFHATLPAAAAPPASRPVRSPAEEEANAFLTPDFFARLARADEEEETPDTPAAAPGTAPPGHPPPRSQPPRQKAAAQVTAPSVAPAAADPDTQPHDRFDSMFSDWSPLDPLPASPAPPASRPRPPVADAGAPREADGGAWLTQEEVRTDDDDDRPSRPARSAPAQRARRPGRVALVGLAVVALAGLGAWQLMAPRAPQQAERTAGADVGGVAQADPAARQRQDAEASLRRAEQALAASTGAAQAAASASAAAFPLPAEPTGAGPRTSLSEGEEIVDDPAPPAGPSAASKARRSVAAATAAGRGDGSGASTSTSTLTANASADNPRAACGTRTLFSLYRCMQTQCSQRRWSAHPQCERLRATDDVN